MTIGRRPACYDCAHFNRGEVGQETCTAFPDGIPVEIFFQGVDHREPFPGDHGIQWAPAEGGAGYPPELEQAPPS